MSRKFSPAIQRLVDQAERERARARATYLSPYSHRDVPGAGARRRRVLHLTPAQKVRYVMGEFKRGTLRSGRAGYPVRSRKQAIAIAMSEAGLAWKKGRRR